MAKIKIQGNASGTGVITLTAPATDVDRTITLPDGDITLGGGGSSSGGGGGWVPLSTVTTSSGDTSIEITANIDSTYDSYVMKITGLPTGNTFGPKMHFSTNGGTSYDTSTSMYRSTIYGVHYYSTSFWGPYASSSSGYFQISANNGIQSAYVYLYKLADTGKSYYSVSGGIGHWANGYHSLEAMGVYGAINTDPVNDTTPAVDALRIITTVSGGFPAGGRVTLYGIANS
jgi:hypothetical protein